MKYRCAIPITRLKRRVDFVALTTYSKKQGSKSITPAFILQLQPLPQEHSQGLAIGFTATKKLGNSVVRSTAKRRLRAVVDETIRLNPAFQGHKSKQGYHINLIARHKVLTRPIEDMGQDLQNAMRYHKFVWKK